LRNHARTLVRIRLVGGDVDGLLAQALDKAATDRGVLDQKSGGTIALLGLDDLAYFLFFALFFFEGESF
jgi:hypothetical protein